MVSQGPWHSCLREESSHSSLSLRLLERHLETRLVSHQKCQFLSLSKIIKFKALLLRLAHLGLLLAAGVIPQGQAASPTLPYRLSSERVRFTQLVLNNS